MEEKSLRGNGKLLLTGEYFVLDGAKALAVPTKLGQTFHVKTTPAATSNLCWKSFDNQAQCWFEVNIDLDNFQVINSSDSEVAERLLDFFVVIKKLNPSFFEEKQNFEIKTVLEFPRDWGLGSSSTLIYCLAKWSKTNPYTLLFQTMGGSGYDIACAGVQKAIVYQKNGKDCSFETVNFQPAFAHNLYFIHLGKKQNSREGIARYRAQKNDVGKVIDEINQLTQAALIANDLTDFEKTIIAHESLIGKWLDLPLVKDLYFSDYFGSIKSLGAWGGDFVLATSNRTEKETFEYFQKNGFQTILPYHKIILNV